MGDYIMNNSYIETEPSLLSSLNNVRIENAIFDAVRIDNELTDDFDISEDWNTTTKLMAFFRGNLYAGNVNLGIDNTTNIIIKRREVGQFEWFNMFDIPVVDIDNFNFNLIDRYASSGVEYQYAVVPIISGLEGEYNLGTSEETGEDHISCDFGGFILLDRDTEYGSYLDVSFDTQKNQARSSVVPLNSKYPYVIKNSQSNYYSGNVSATFVKIENCEHNKKDSRKYRYELLDFLVNDNVKIIKYFDGRSYMVEITEVPTDTASEHPDKHTISFTFMEVGDFLSNEDMYINGFLDISEEWWNT